MQPITAFQTYIYTQVDQTQTLHLHEWGNLHLHSGEATLSIKWGASLKNYRRRKGEMETGTEYETVLTRH